MPDKNNERIRVYARYSGMAFQLFGLLAVAVFLGLKADAYFQFDNKYLTAVFCLLVLFAYFYKMVRVTSPK